MSIVERILRVFLSYAELAQGWNPQEEDDYQDFVDAVGNALAPAEQGGRVDDGMLRNVLGNVIKSMRATGRSWGPTRQAQVLDTWADEIETTLEAALAQNAQEEAAVEIVEWKENASPRLRFFTKVSNLPAGTKLYTHAERARVPDGWKLAMFVLQSGMYAKLPEEERAVCDALIAENPFITAPSAPEGDGGGE